MPYIEGEDRHQIHLLPNTLDDFVEEENPVRVIDAYVDSLALEELGFQVYSGTKSGQKPYRREDLLKLYLYCYMNGIRSSRKMETETKRNIELMWLIGKLHPDHGTLSAFMKNNQTAIKKLFKGFTLLLKGFGLIDGQLVAIDGTKLKANCSKKQHFNANIVSKKLEYIDEKIDAYLHDFLTEDNRQKKQEITEKLEVYQERMHELQVIKQKLKKTGEKQLCVTDPDAKSMKNNGKHEVCFNVQTAVDSKYKLIVDCDTVNDVNDQGQLSNMAEKTKQVFHDQKTTILADTGYYNYLEIIDVVDESTELLIKPQKGKQNKVASGFDKENFEYDAINDRYICPLGYELPFKWNGKQNGKEYRRYTCEAFDICGQKESCTSAKGGRAVTRLKDEEVIEKITENTRSQSNIYKQRAAIVEHPFGTMKRHLGYTYFLTRGLASVGTETNLICLAYNFKRMIKIKGVKDLIRLFSDQARSKSNMQGVYLSKIA
ncbi:IS1182 family transposase [Paenibacillus sophorae]|uniref:IS1182 family transposase n=4 Tax=Paenibacillus sophorae TaxID=1333845 RepID=A0ABX8H6G1_9BACL|nr:IS1182 family transposase [Paenibacillus sophorae]QWU13266.1 IS1182 family transposase [Paenibacillus sophorae]QWU15333.1 IS1182 family transposase [Paenibacillus sophorae]